MKIIVRDAPARLTTPVVAAIALNIAIAIWFKTMDLSVGSEMGWAIELAFAGIAYFAVYRRLGGAHAPPRAAAGYLAFMNGFFAISSAGSGQRLVMVLLALGAAVCLLSVYWGLSERARVIDLSTETAGRGSAFDSDQS